jgi:hypothetical protein
MKTFYLRLQNLRVHPCVKTNIETSAADITHLPRQKAPHRSGVSNGNKLLPLVDSRSVTYRRFKDLYQDIASDLGGLDHLSEGQKQLIRRASMLSAERMEAMSARGERELDLAEYGAAADRIGRILQRLGLSRLATDVNKDERSLADMFRNAQPPPEDEV